MSSAFLLGCSQISFAGDSEHCNSGKCQSDKSVEVTAVSTAAAGEGSVCAKGECHGEKTVAVTTASTAAAGEGSVCAKGECHGEKTVAVATASTAAAGEGSVCAKGECHGDKAVAALAEGHERLQYVVTGMTCKGCTSAVAKSLKGIEGVTVQSLDHKTGIAVVDFDASKAKKAEVAGAINQGEILITAERVTVPVAGMTCGSCSNKVTEALNAVEGVTVQSVCHKSGKAVVDVVADKSDRAAVVKVITDAGYKAS